MSRLQWSQEKTPRPESLSTHFEEENHNPLQRLFVLVYIYFLLVYFEFLYFFNSGFYINAQR